MDRCVLIADSTTLPQLTSLPTRGALTVVLISCHGHIITTRWLKLNWLTFS